MLKTLFVLLLVLAGAGFLGYYFVPQHMPAFLKPERRACQRMVAQCEVQGGSEVDKCVELFGEFRKTGGDESVKKPIQCLMESKSCMESAGCMGGAAGNQMLQLLKGFGKSLGEGVTKSLGE